MPAITTLQDLFVHQLRDIYSAERQLVAALPKMAKNATSDELRDAFSTHLGQTQEHVSRLEQVFELLGVSSRGPKCKAMEGLVEEGTELLESHIVSEVLDAGLIAAAQRVEHYEIAAYGTVCEFARGLGHSDVLELLQRTLDEERTTDELLTILAVGGVNHLAGREVDVEMKDDSEGKEAADSESGVMKGRGKRAPAKSAKRAAKKSPARSASRP